MILYVRFFTINYFIEFLQLVLTQHEYELRCNGILIKQNWYNVPYLGITLYMCCVLKKITTNQHNYSLSDCNQADNCRRMNQQYWYKSGHKVLFLHWLHIHFYLSWQNHNCNMQWYLIINILTTAIVSIFSISRLTAAWKWSNSVCADLSTWALSSIRSTLIYI